MALATLGLVCPILTDPGPGPRGHGRCQAQLTRAQSAQGPSAGSPGGLCIHGWESGSLNWGAASPLAASAADCLQPWLFVHAVSAGSKAACVSGMWEGVQILQIKRGKLPAVGKRGAGVGSCCRDRPLSCPLHTVAFLGPKEASIPDASGMNVETWAESGHWYVPGQ